LSGHTDPRQAFYQALYEPRTTRLAVRAAVDLTGTQYRILTSFPTSVAACRSIIGAAGGEGEDTEKAQKRELDRAYIQLGRDRQHRPRFELLSARSLLRLLRSSSDGRPMDGTSWL
jgi:hypothetical protein